MVGLSEADLNISISPMEAWVDQKGAVAWNVNLFWGFMEFVLLRCNCKEWVNIVIVSLLISI